MAATSTSIMISFSPGARGRLKASQPQTFKRLDLAVAAAEKVLGRFVGSAVIEQLPDEFAEPKLIKSFGRLPAAFEESLAA